MEILFCCLMLVCRYFVLFDVGYGDTLCCSMLGMEILFFLFDVGMQILCAV